MTTIRKPPRRPERTTATPRPSSRARTTACELAKPEIATRTPGATQAGSVEDSFTFTGSAAGVLAAVSALAPGLVTSTATSTPKNTTIRPAKATTRTCRSCTAAAVSSSL